MLPKLKLPTYFVELIGDGKKHKIHPYTVKDQELLLLALESANTEEIIEACNQLIENCTEDVDIKKLATFDFEMLFLKLRAVSSGEVIELIVPHTECGNKQNVELKIDDIKFKTFDNHSKTIEFTNDVGVVMRYPTFIETTTLSTKELILNCIESIYDKDNVIDASTVPSNELEEWINSFENKYLIKIRDFFLTMPKVFLEVKFKCSKCGEEQTRIVEGFENFFS